MRGRHAAGGWSPFWRDVLLRATLVLLLIAMAAFIWWLFSEDDLFEDATDTTSTQATAGTVSSSEPEVVTTAQPGTTSPPETSSTTRVTAAESTTTTTATTTTTPTTTLPPPLEPSELVVQVFNANGVGGVAGRTTSLLAEAGYGVETPDNHPQFLDVSRVWFRAGLSREAKVIQETLIPDALVEPIPLEQEGVDIVVVLGRSFEE